MYFSEEFSTGISFACVGVAGMSFLFSKHRNPSTDGFVLQHNIKEDLEDDTDDRFFDAETGSGQSMIKENLLYKNAVEKRAFRDLQHNFEECMLNCLAVEYNMIQTIQRTANKQKLMIEGLKLIVAGVRTDLNTCIEKIIGMDHITFRALLLMSINQGVGAAVTSAEEKRFNRHQPRNTLCHQPTTSSSLTLAGPPPVHLVPKPSPPPPSVTSGFEPPPPMIITTTGISQYCGVSSRRRRAPPIQLVLIKKPRKPSAVSS
ncbi:hypothetical protein QTP88_021725 [Uroleucon formosanum]